MGGFLGVLGSIIAGGAVATATIFGLVSSQTGPAEESPTDVSSPIVVDYGSTS